MAKYILIVGACFSGLSVAVGAFGAHAFKPFLEQIGRVDTFETAVKYQFYHSLALLLVGILYLQSPVKWFGIAAMLFVAGILVFSGSLYALCATQAKWWGAVTPLGGVAFILGWGVLAWGAAKTF